MRAETRAVLILLATATLASPALAQSKWRFSAGAGTLEWDASGTGQSTAFVLRADRGLTRWLGLELGASYASLNEQFQTSPTRTLGLEPQIQFRVPLPRVQPYVGLGPALFSYLTNAGGRHSVEPGYSIGAGLRAQLAHRVGLVADARLRGWDFEHATDFTVNSAGEVTLGLTLIRP